MKYTDEEIIAKIKTHLLSQAERSFIHLPGHTFCAYRSNDGKNLKCAIGCLIPDEHYLPAFESHPIRNIWGVFEGLGYEKSQMNLLATFQCIHDTFLAHQWKKAIEHAEELHRKGLDWALIKNSVFNLDLTK